MSTRLTVPTALATVLLVPISEADVIVHERGGNWTEAVATIDAPPDEVYALATDYGRWKQTFSDIESMKVERGGREDARVRFRSRALEHTVTVQFTNTPNRELRFVGVEGPPGGRAKGAYTITPLEGGRSKVTAMLYMDVVGVAGVFVRDRTLRGYRQAKLRADLGDLVRHYARRATETSDRK